MPTLKHKAFAYITHQDRLLVFRHVDFPEAGIQVPAGTIEHAESPEAAVMREAREETGLMDLVPGAFLGEHRRDMRDFDEIHQRYFYHLRCTSIPPATWRHGELAPADGTHAPIIFEFFWVRMPHELPALIADHGYFLPQLCTII